MAAPRACAIDPANNPSQRGEISALLPLLLRAAAGTRGTFVEIGALDGLRFSNSLLLERCYNFTGLLVEAMPSNAAKLMRSGRTAAKVHSAVCNSVSSVSMLASGNNAMHKMLLDNSTSHRKAVQVPCRPLQQLMREQAGLDQATFLSLDVEGAEEIVLATVGESHASHSLPSPYPACAHVHTHC